ncbi:radical SAM family heme chaperone HemW [Roseofilum sp. BLCC_M91]|uniref:Heme chaperone HemW n=1 Tax=Roseofilum halophilum BLCC-M91 TaxID=3022259 RepID=A0ABT7BMR6_9CYAN|nr:radical SAM family heme chaperone HemW [Roseofilum halophilum]MDJ1179573.1 radical SAM family heme chaperone HemW [Roseofilum halophilum BLCC-M91]
MEHQEKSLPIPRSAYLHIPFCRRRCFYCDFAISVVGDRRWGEHSPAISHYIQELITEIEQTLPPGLPLDTVFFGGGTPSLLSVAQLEQLLTTLDRHFGLTSTAEISMEIDPGTFDLDKLQGFLDLGVNRISLGVQSFDDSLLKLCGRSHTVSEIYQAIDLLHQASVDNFSIDLISGLPEQDLEQWQETLQTALEISPPHLSVYDLIVEPMTVFERRYESGKLNLPTDETSAQFYRLTSQILRQAGYDHYEISNYALPGYHCRHNLVYWHNQPYYGWGMGAASYIDSIRFTRPRTRQTYYQWLQDGGVMNTPPLSSTEQLLETLMLGLRLAEGLSLKTLTDRFGYPPLQQLSPSWYPYYQQGWINLNTLNGQPWLPGQPLPSTGQICLSDPEGFLFSNTVLAQMFQVFS